MRRLLALLLLLAAPAHADFMSGGGLPGSTTGTGTTGNLTAWASSSTLGDYSGSSACGAGSFVTQLSAAGAVTCTAASGTISGLTTGLIPEAASATSLQDSGAYRIAIPNDGTTGTTVETLVKLTSAGAAIITSAAETSGILGVVKSGAGTTGSAIVTLIGLNNCVSDNGTTAGHYAGVSSSVAGDCTDLGASFPTSGTQVIGTWQETGAAGSRSLLFNTSDVASVSGGGGGGGSKNPAGAAGDVQYRATGNNFAAEAAFNYSASTNSLALTGGTPATNNQQGMAYFQGTLGSGNTTDYNNGVFVNITSAGNVSSSFHQEAFRAQLNAGLTGAQPTLAATFSNSAAGTQTGLDLNVYGLNTGNYGADSFALASTTGLNIGLAGFAAGSSNINAGVYGKASDTPAGTNVGVIANAANSTEGTGPKNIALFATLNNVEPSSSTYGNVSYAALIDGGTLPSSGSVVEEVKGTLTASATAQQIGISHDITGNGSSSQVMDAERIVLFAGYTGSSRNAALETINQSVGTGTTLSLGQSGNTQNPSLNIGTASFINTSSTSGYNVGDFGDAAGSTGLNVGVYGRSGDNKAGTNVAVLGNATNSTEGTNLKNVGGFFSIGTTDPAAIASNTSVALAADGAGSDEIRGYNGSTNNFTVASTGAISTSSTITSSRTTDLGWSIVAGANTACNTTCTSACVMGFASAVTGSDPVSCSDATADNCLCAGAS